MRHAGRRGKSGCPLLRVCHRITGPLWRERRAGRCKAPRRRRCGHIVEERQRRRCPPTAAPRRAAARRPAGCVARSLHTAAGMLVARVLPAGLGAAAKWACYSVTDPKIPSGGRDLRPGFFVLAESGILIPQLRGRIFWNLKVAGRFLEACPRIRRGRARGACEASSRREEDAMWAHRRRRATQRSPAIPTRPKGSGRRGGICFVGAPRRCNDIACVAPPRICPRGARNAAPPNSRTGS